MGCEEDDFVTSSVMRGKRANGRASISMDSSCM
jgi:hypothetical protein